LIQVLETVSALPPQHSTLTPGDAVHESSDANVVHAAALSRSPKPKQLSVVNVQSTTIAPKESVTYAKQTQTIESGPDISSRGRGGGVDYYTLTYNYDDDDEKYEEGKRPA
jgi:hypothetical protein